MTIRIPRRIKKRRIKIMNNVATIILFVMMAIMGGVSSLYLVISLPVVIIWKIYRKIRYGYKLTD